MSDREPPAHRLTATIEVPASVAVTMAPPDLISQENSLAVAGIPPDAFLRLLRAPGFTVDVIRLGKLRLVDREAFLAWVRARTHAPRPAAARSGTLEDDVADVLAEVGCERVGARRGRA